jgi:hypothetical protein|tara:strand:+ start:50 stop:316 length:267 start_codon:yes stop_codon:yes gene_type:complete
METPKPKYKVGTLFSCVPRVIPSDHFSFAMILRRRVMEIKGGDWSFGPQWYYDLILFSEEIHRVVETDLDELIESGIMTIISEGHDEI